MSQGRSRGDRGRRGHHRPAPSEVAGLGRLPEPLCSAVAGAGCRCPASPGRRPLAGMEEVLPAGPRQNKAPCVRPQRVPAALPTGRKRQRGHGLRGAPPHPLRPPGLWPWHTVGTVTPGLAWLCPVTTVPLPLAQPHGIGAQRRESRSSRPRGGCSPKEPRGGVSGGSCDHREQLVTSPPQQQREGTALVQGDERSGQAGEGSAPGQEQPPNVWGAPRTALCVTSDLCCPGGQAGTPARHSHVSRCSIPAGAVKISLAAELPSLPMSLCCADRHPL